MKKWLGIGIIIALSSILIAAETRSLGTGFIFTSFKTSVELEAEGGNTLSWWIINQSTKILTTEVRISAGNFSKTYSLTIPSRGSTHDFVDCNLEAPVKWKAYGKISFYQYGGQEVDIATFNIQPSRNEEDEGVDLPRP